MIIRQTTNTNDWTFGSGIGSYLFGEAAIEQNIKTKLLEWQGDCFYNIVAGVDWNNLLDIGQKDNILAAVKGVVMSAFGVLALTAFTSSFDAQARSLSIQMTITTIFSPSATIVFITPLAGVL